MSPDAAQPATASSYPCCADRLPERALDEGRFEVRFARDAGELDAVLRLRFEVFNLELGEGLEESRTSGRDRDEFDAVCHHLMVMDRDDDRVVGSYRMQTAGMAARHLGFYSDREFDLSAVPDDVMAASLEIGRACVARSHRSTQVLYLLWRGLALYVATNAKRYLFGCSSLTSQDGAEARALMDHLVTGGHLDPRVRVEPRPGSRAYEAGDGPAPARAVTVPPLFRTYLRHGATVCGPPAIDRDFGTVDYLMLFDVEAMPERMRRTFFG